VGTALFIALRAPVVAVSDRALVLNPSLRDLGLARRVDPYVAWQKLSLFPGNTPVARRAAAVAAHRRRAQGARPRLRRAVLPEHEDAPEIGRAHV
jgi:hypothetical protein